MKASHSMLAPCALATIGAIASLTFGTQAQSQNKSVTAEGAVLKELSAEFAFTEGPSADAQGNVFFTDQPNDRIVRWDATTGALTDWLKPSGRSNGTFFDANGNLDFWPAPMKKTSSGPSPLKKRSNDCWAKSKGRHSMGPMISGSGQTERSILPIPCIPEIIGNALLTCSKMGNTFTSLPRDPPNPFR